MKTFQFTRRGGNMIVEFVLVFPVFLMMVHFVFESIFICGHRLALQRTAFDSARQLALSSLRTPDEMEASLENRLKTFGTPIASKVSIQVVPSTPSNHFRARKNVQIIKVLLRERLGPQIPLLKLLAHQDAFYLTASHSRIRIVVQP